MKIVIPELENPIMKEALNAFEKLEVVKAPDLETAATMVANKEVDSMVSGLDYSSRDVVIAYKNHIPLASPFFSSCFVCKRHDDSIIIADGGVNKHPSADQLYTIVEDTAKTHELYFGTTPRIAMLSYSTKGSGGKNDDLEKIYFVIDKIRSNHEDWFIDGEMQLDAAVNPRVGEKKIPGSRVAGHANILITPDLNSGNILYKSLEQFAGYTVAGPIIQGFSVPLADLSRGSSAEDICLTIDVIVKMLERNNK